MSRAKKAPQPAKPAAAFTPRVCADFHRHTCIEVARADGVVKYIPLDILGFDIQEAGEQAFDRQFKPMPDYPVDKAAKLYAGYAADLGGSEEAMQALASLTPLSPTEISMATTKKAAVAKKDAAPAAKKAAAKKAAPAAKKAAPAAKKAAPAKKEAAGERKPSAAQMFKDLIMAGKLTDDQIFEKVQKEFGLDDNKRSYVKWYRNDLAKKGLNPPAAKG